MQHPKLVEAGFSETDIASLFEDGNTTAITIRMPASLRDATKQEAKRQGVSFSEFVRTSIIKELEGVR